MKFIKRLMRNLPRRFVIWWGKMLLYMIAVPGRKEFGDDVKVFRPLGFWVDSKGGEVQKIAELDYDRYHEFAQLGRPIYRGPK